MGGCVGTCQDNSFYFLTVKNNAIIQHKEFADIVPYSGNFYPPGDFIGLRHFIPLVKKGVPKVRQFLPLPNSVTLEKLMNFLCASVSSSIKWEAFSSVQLLSCVRLSAFFISAF